MRLKSRGNGSGRRHLGIQNRQADLVRVAGTLAVLYVHLWIAEGALRKWVPGSDGIMYLARDAVAIGVLLFLAIAPVRARRGQGLFWAALLAMAVAAFATVLVAELPLSVAVAGVRSYISPFILPLVVFSYQPPGILQKIARAVLVWVPVQLVLGLAQSTAPPSSWINREISGEETRFVQDGIVRITGTFTAPSGLTSFLVLAFALALSALVGSNILSRRAGLVLLLLTGMTIAISGARGTVLGVVVILILVLLHAFINDPARSLRIAMIVSVISAAVWLLASWLLPQVLAAFVGRFEAADRAEDTGGRLLNQTVGFLFTENLSLTGSGVGGSSIVGIALGSGQQWVEIESSRWVSEMGILGILLALARLAIGLGIAGSVILNARRHSTVTVVLVAVIAPLLVFGTIGQNPSYQGAFGVSLALLIASALEDKRSPDSVAANEARSKRNRRVSREA
ncbi:hypothetical protein GCM10009758_32030 [Microbacterium hatanonis]